MKRAWWLLALAGALALNGCRAQAENTPSAAAAEGTPTAMVLITPVQARVPEVPGATPIPLEPWSEGASLPQVPIRSVAALWMQPILQVIVEGDLPTPCHKLRAVLNPKVPPGVVDIRLVAEPPAQDVACAQVIQPFKVVLNIQPPSPPVRVLVNGRAAHIVR